MPADPLPGRPESLKPLLLRVSEDGYGDLYRQHLFDQYRLVVEMGMEEQWWWGLKDGPTVALAKHHPGVPRGAWRWGVAHDAAHSGWLLPDGLT